MYVNTDSNCSWTTDPDLVLGCSPGQKLPWPPVAAQAPLISMAPEVALPSGINMISQVMAQTTGLHLAWTLMVAQVQTSTQTLVAEGHGPRHVPWWQQGPSHHMVSGGHTGIHVSLPFTVFPSSVLPLSTARGPLCLSLQTFPHSLLMVRTLAVWYPQQAS